MRHVGLSHELDGGVQSEGAAHGIAVPHADGIPPVPPAPLEAEVAGPPPVELEVVPPAPTLPLLAAVEDRELVDEWPPAAPMPWPSHALDAITTPATMSVE
jgi:hypothetical protein